MNQDNDHQKVTNVDPQVSGQYESLANEKTPARLDRAVLREATRAVRADNRKGSFGAWFRPVAFMVTVGLSLAIILDLSDTSIFNPVTDLSIEAAPTVQAPTGSAADRAGRDPSQSALSEIKRQEKLAPDTDIDDAAVAKSRAAATESPPPDQGQLQKMRREMIPAITPPQAEPVEDQSRTSDALTAEVESAEERIRKVERAVDANKQAQPARAAQFTAPQAAITTESLLLVAPAACSEEQKSDVEEWWKCIESLRESGLADVVDLELGNLREAFPDFEPPE
jgi:hypothetical protein